MQYFYTNLENKNISEFFFFIITYLKSNFNYINDNTIKSLKELAYTTLKEDRKTICESQFLKCINYDELIEMTH